MLNYIYDGSFEGLLTCIHEAYYRHEKPQQVLREVPEQPSLLEQNQFISADQVKAMKVYNAIKEKVSYQALKNAYSTYLSDLPEAGTLVYQYVRLGFSMGRDLTLFLSDDRVLKVENISRKVFGESHRMLGLLRFKQVNPQLYYAQMEPDHHITSLVAPHFAQRMADQNWIIHDLKRGCAAVYNRKDWVMTQVQELDMAAAGDVEMDYQDLWKLYFKSIAIPNRVNPKLQRRMMPARYWKHLVEI